MFLNARRMNPRVLMKHVDSDTWVHPHVGSSTRGFVPANEKSVFGSCDFFFFVSLRLIAHAHAHAGGIPVQMQPTLFVFSRASC